MGLRYTVGLATNPQALGTGLTTGGYTTWTAEPAGLSWAVVDVLYGTSVQGVDSFVGIKTDGTLWGWGDNYQGELGLNDWTERASPVQLTTGTFSTVATGVGNGYAIKSDGTLWVWGKNTAYELGLGHATYQNVPVQCGTDTDWVAVQALSLAAIAIKSDGTLWSVGSNTNGRTGQGTDVGTTTAWTKIGVATTWAAIATGYNHALALTTGGLLFGWGNNDAGAQLGASLGATTTVPTQIGASTWTKIAAATNSGSAAVRSDGALYVSGYNTYGMLGVAPAPTTDWTLVSGITAENVWMSSFTTVVLSTAGTAYGAGRNEYYALGLPSTSNYTTFTVITALAGLVDYASSSFHSQAVLGAPPAIVEDIADDAYSTEAVTTAQVSNSSMADTAGAAETLASGLFSVYVDAIGLLDGVSAKSNTTSALTDTGAALDVIQQAINQIVADGANGADSLSLGAALTLVDIADAVASQTPSYNSVMMVAELIAALEAYNGADGYDITESGALSDAYVARVEALVAMLEAAQAVDTNTALVHVMQTATDSAEGATAITSTGSLITALLADSALTTIRLNIGGELFTGWVLNADTLAPSEYQFADLQFNSACKHGGTYLLAADDGIYQFTEDTGVETVMTYIKTGKTDFGSDMRKSVTNAYMVYSAAGQMTLKVTTSANGALQTNNYVMLPFAADDTPDPQRVTVGKGLKSRYWQFELTGANAGCKFDEIGMLPVVLTRRI